VSENYVRSVAIGDVVRVRGDSVAVHFSPFLTDVRTSRKAKTKVLVGTVLGLRSATVQIRPKTSGEELRISLSMIEVMELRKEGNHGLLGAVVGYVSGAIVGGEVAEALRYFGEGRMRGKIVVTVGNEPSSH
jgi:hypothetical protein